MTVIGISSSPVSGGNVDRMVRHILDRCRMPSTFVNLSELTFSPCRACAHLCAGDNLCRLDDDLRPLYPLMMEADAFVLGTPSYFNTMNASMTVFLERLWAFRHQRFPLEGKPFAVVASGGVECPDKAVDAVRDRMTAYRARFIGKAAFRSTILPCFRCGYRTGCEVGAFQAVYGECDRKNSKIRRDWFKKWEDDPTIINNINHIVTTIKALKVV